MIRIRIRTRHLLPALLTTTALLAGYRGLQTVPSVSSQTQPRTQHAQLAATTVTSQPIARTWTPPDVSKIPAGLDGESILLGMHIFEETPRYAAKYVGSQISCGSCHLSGGTMSYGIALVGASGWFPMYSDRAKRDIMLEDRIQECVTRSENGTPLPHGGPEVTALISYMTWISQQGAAEGIIPVRGVDAKMPTLQGDATRGEAIYKEQCSGCHGADGNGVPGILPALWGPGSYNNGAGMNQPRRMAPFVLHNMPQNNPGKLMPQEAWDVSTYIAGKPHSQYNSAYDIY
jgi:thiosulfate dehydrogenase